MRQKIQRRINQLLFIFIIFLMFGESVRAFEVPARLMYSGYTAEGIYFEVYEVCHEMSPMSADEIEAFVRIEYSGIVQPPTTYEYTKMINGERYSGTLCLYRIETTNGTTYAYYKGTLHHES